MRTVASRLTVLFENPFWIGLYERESDGCYEACKITFGAEPKDGEVYNFVLRNWHRLRFSPPVKVQTVETKAVNPKRMQRLIHRQMQNTGIGTKAQQALKLQLEQGKQNRTERSKQRRELEKDRQFELRQQKRKERHRGH